MALEDFSAEDGCISLGMVVSSAAVNQQSVHKLLEKLKKSSYEIFNRFVC